MIPPIRYSSRVALALFTLGLILAASAKAQFTAINDDFSTAGSLSGSTPDSGVGNWTNISGTGGLTISSGALNIAAGGGESAQLNFSSSNLASGTIYMGFTFTVGASGNIGTSDFIQAFAGFRTGTAASGNYALGFGDFRPSGNAQTNSGLPSASTSQVIVGLFTGSSYNAASATPPLTAWATPLDRGTSYRAVIGFDITNNTGSLWINPSSSASTSITLSGVNMDPRGIFFREGAQSHGALTMDNVNVSTNFATAMSAIPEPSTYAAICGGLALAGAMWHRRRRAKIALRAG